MTSSQLNDCTDGTAYVSLLTEHAAAAGQTTTFLTKIDTPKLRLQRRTRQFESQIVLLRSLRAVERRCRREFLLLHGTELEGDGEWAVAEARLRREGSVRTLRVNPIFVGIPSSDKLHAFLLNPSRYRRLLLLDSDVLVLRSLDQLFEASEPFVIAHHPYDLQQAQCGIPLERRGVGAMFLIRPSVADFNGVVALMRSKNPKMREGYSEQTALVCHFANRSSTLPCPYLFDLGSPGSSTCSPANPGSKVCLRKHLQNCKRWGIAGLRKTCTLSPVERCDAFGGDANCDAVSAHVRRDCMWAEVSRRVRAVHFKGKIKPWPSRQYANFKCSPQRRGALRLGSHRNASAVAVDDDLLWDRVSQRCYSRMQHAPVHWNTGAVVPKPCCHFATHLAGRWHELLKGK